MTKFKVYIETTAEFDFRGIMHYITETLKEPDVAIRIYGSISTQITSLEHLPLLYPLINDETFAVRGLRKMPIENYLVFYYVNESANEVHVLRILHKRREWQNIL